MPFEPSLSFRFDRGTDIRPAPLQRPAFCLTRSSRLTLLIHGYNNDEDAATDAYDAFRDLLTEGGRRGANLIGVYWPGSNWSNIFFYMRSIGRAQGTAQRLAAAIRQAAAAYPTLQIGIVAHSMGCRLTLELLKHLSDLPNIQFRAALMAAAVPTFMLRADGPLRSTVTNPQREVLSLYSSGDSVLKIAFRLGQSAARGPEGFLPIALGAARFTDADPVVAASLSQFPSEGAGHSDYWGWKDKTRDTARRANLAVDTFLHPFTAAPRMTPVRHTPQRHADEPRATSTRRTPTRSSPDRPG